jgi:hypothetical protein
MDHRSFTHDHWPGHHEAVNILNSGKYRRINLSFGADSIGSKAITSHSTRRSMTVTG